MRLSRSRSDPTTACSPFRRLQMHSSTRLPDRCHNSSRPVSFSLGVLTQNNYTMLSTSQPPKRDRLSLHSFSIRDLFLVTMIVALAVALWMQRCQSQVDAVRIEQLTKEAKR